MFTCSHETLGVICLVYLCIFLLFYIIFLYLYLSEWDFPIIASFSHYHVFVSSHNSVIGSDCHSNLSNLCRCHFSLFFDRGVKSHFSEHMISYMQCLQDVSATCCYCWASQLLPAKLSFLLRPRRYCGISWLPHHQDAVTSQLWSMEFNAIPLSLTSFQTSLLGVKYSCQVLW